MIYLDNAATSYPKPGAVSDAILLSMKNSGGNPGRSSHSMSASASIEIFEARRELAGLFSAKPENIIFTYNATYAINIALKSSYVYGTHILISDLEHNSVLRPVAAVTGNSFSSYSFFDSCVEKSENERRHAVISSIRSKMRPLTKTLICTARSNITGAALPIREIGRFCRENDIFFIVDAAQSAGYDDIDVELDYIDALCVPGHKGLYGPSGTGFVVYSEHGASCGRVGSFIEGGTGVASFDIGMPTTFPEQLEAGTLAVASISGLRAGVGYITNIGLKNIREHESNLVRRAYMSLSFNEKINFYGFTPSSSLLLFNINSISPEETASMLDNKGICVRAGFHCAPVAHKRIGTPPSGAVRMSAGIQNSIEEIDIFIKAVNEISANT